MFDGTTITRRFGGVGTPAPCDSENTIFADTFTTTAIPPVPQPFEEFPARYLKPAFNPAGGTAVKI